MDEAGVPRLADFSMAELKRWHDKGLSLNEFASRPYLDEIPTVCSISTFEHLDSLSRHGRTTSTKVVGRISTWMAIALRVHGSTPIC